MAYVEVDLEVDDYLEEASTTALKEELARRKMEEDAPLREPPAHIIADLKRAFETQNPHEFYFFVRKIEMILEAVDG